MNSLEVFTYMISKIWDYYVLIDTALSDLYLYEITTFMFVCYVIYFFYYISIVDHSSYYINAIDNAFFFTCFNIYKSKGDDSEFEWDYIMKIFIYWTISVSLMLDFVHLYTSEMFCMSMLQKINPVNFFYLFWMFFVMFCNNLKLEMDSEKFVPFLVMDYLIEGETHNFMWNKVYGVLNFFNNHLASNTNSHYAFVWAMFFCAIFVIWMKIPLTYMVELYLATFILIMFANLLWAILFSRVYSYKVSAYFMNQLFYIMLGAVFLLYMSCEWYNPTYASNVNLDGYFLLTNGVFYFKIWIIFFFLLCLILSNAYVRRSSSSFIELSILFSASVPILFIMTALTDIFAMMLSFEVLSLIMIGLCGLSMDNASTEASIKYFCQNSIMTGLTFFGVFFYLFIFKNTNLLLTQLFIELIYETKMVTYFFNVLLFSSMILWLLSFMFKFGIFPVNFYVADIYSGSSAPVILFMSSVIKPAVLFVFAIKVVPLFSFQVIVVSMISCFCVSSMILGDWMSLNTHNLKSFFGHSSVSQYGFLMLAVFSQSSEAFFYAFTYCFMYNISLFMILTMLVEHSNFDLVDLSNLYFSDLNLYFNYNLSLKLLITVCFLMMSGVPPFVLFLFKYLMFVEVFSVGNYVFLFMIFIFSTGVSSAYYFKIINDIWFVNLQDYKVNGLFEKKSMLLDDGAITTNSKVYIFWFLIVFISYVIFVHFDSMFYFGMACVFNEWDFTYYFA